MRRVISPRLAIRILWNGGESYDDTVCAENVRLELVDMTSMVWGKARCNCEDESHRDAELFEMMRTPPLQAVLRNKEDILLAL